MLDIERLFTETGVVHERMNRRGTVNLGCPKCGSRDNLAWLSRRQYFRCWSCGVLPTVETIAQLTGLSAPTIPALLKKYQTRHVQAQEEVLKGGATTLTYPDGTGPLLPAHLAYLKGRGLDPDQVQEEFGPIYGTGPMAAELPNRIIFPLYLEGKAVSWQARSIHPQCDQKYRYHTCPPDKEIIHHKNIAYGLDGVAGESVLICEGVFDVMKMGRGCCHLFGISWLNVQLNELANRFSSVYVMFDSEPGAQASGKRLAEALSGLGVISVIIDPECVKDPGEWPIDQARAVRKQLLGF